MDVGLLNELLEAALTLHKQACVNAFCGVRGTSTNYWDRCRGFGRSSEDEETLLANLRLLAETPDCPCRTGEEWEEWFEDGLDLPVLAWWEG